VTKDTPNKGRAYYHCPSRACGFFAWADGGEVAFQRGGTAAALQWARLPQELHIVSDFGFRAQDLRQGGVGDCWFMSALAVVAERHDLIAALFAADTARNAAGLYSLRLFLDGAWRSVRIDDLLPVTAAPRREALAFDTKLAFCRCGSASGEQQLWASLVEKAYAKAHGSYQAISGGQVAEALLDLTGAPTDMIDLGHAHFDSETMCASIAYMALCYAMLCYAMLCYAMLCYAMLSYPILSYAVLCCAMLCSEVVDGMFVVNRLIDIVFIAEIVVSFCEK
jgi:calpain-15